MRSLLCVLLCWIGACSAAPELPRRTTLAFAFPKEFAVHGWDMWWVVFRADSGHCLDEELVDVGFEIFGKARLNADGLPNAATGFECARWRQVFPDLRGMQRAEGWKLGATECAERFVGSGEECFLLHDVAFCPFDERLASTASSRAAIVSAVLTAEELPKDAGCSGLHRVTARCPTHGCPVLRISLPAALCRTVSPKTLASGILRVTLLQSTSRGERGHAQGGKCKPLSCPQGLHRVDVSLEPNDLRNG